MEYLSKSDIVTNELRALIRDGGLPAGSVLRQRDIAKRFGISPTPVREALRRLEAEGYVVTELHREATVVHANPVRIQEDYLVMGNLESLAAALAAEKVTDGDIAEITALADRLGDSDLSNAELNELNREFHFRIYECARSPILLSLLSLLWRSATARLPATIQREHMTEEHAEIVEALRAHSPKDAAERTRRHIMSTAPNT